MKLFKKKSHWEKMMKNITQADFAFIKLTLLFLGLSIAATFPILTTIDPYYYLTITAVFALKPILTWMKTM